jgi:hypothetical protein
LAFAFLPNFRELLSVGDFDSAVWPNITQTDGAIPRSELDNQISLAFPAQNFSQEYAAFARTTPFAHLRRWIGTVLA